jgi:hypothetical protein
LGKKRPGYLRIAGWGDLRSIARPAWGQALIFLGEEIVSADVIFSKVRARKKAARILTRSKRFFGEMRTVLGITYRYRMQSIDKSSLLHFANASHINRIFCDDHHPDSD